MMDLWKTVCCLSAQSHRPRDPSASIWQPPGKMCIPLVVNSKWWLLAVTLKSNAKAPHSCQWPALVATGHQKKREKFSCWRLLAFANLKLVTWTGERGVYGAELKSSLELLLSPSSLHGRRQLVCRHKLLTKQWRMFSFEENLCLLGCVGCSNKDNFYFEDKWSPFPVCITLFHFSSERNWQVFTDKLVSSMQATDYRWESAAIQSICNRPFSAASCTSLWSISC